MKTLTMNQKAEAVLRQNDRGGYTVPTAGLYPYQWNWDSAFAAFGFAQFDINRAWEELETLFSGQWDNGMVPHILFHQVDDGYFPGPDVWGTNKALPSSGISQPPVAATFARKIFEKDPQAGAQRFAPLYDKFVAWHRWFMDCRAETGAVCVTHPWESGRDNAADWDMAMANIDTTGVGDYQRRDTSHVDPEMRPTKYDYDRYLAILKFCREHDWDEAIICEKGPFRVADPTLTFTLLRAHRDLKWLGEQLGKQTKELDAWILQLEAGAESLWNEAIGSYDSKDLRTGQFSGSVTSAAFLCWLAGIDDKRMVPQLDRILANSKYSVPSLDPHSEQYDTKRYWRGPVWAVVNTLIGIGLEDMGYQAQAERIRKDCEALISTHGFAEYFDPADGTAAGGGTFTWTAAVWLSWVNGNGQES